jgi:hypothetical protein
MSEPWTYNYYCPHCDRVIQEGQAKHRYEWSTDTYHLECWEQMGEDGPQDDPDAWSGGFAANH